jgi:hypothetical protein
MKKNDNILDCIPVQSCPYGTDEQGRVYLIKEKTKSRLLKRVIAALGRSQDFHIHLDELGTAAWNACDGKRSVLKIAEAMVSSSGAGIAQAEQRLARFFALLARDGFVRWLN